MVGNVCGNVSEVVIEMQFEVMVVEIVEVFIEGCVVVLYFEGVIFFFVIKLFIKEVMEMVQYDEKQVVDVGGKEDEVWRFIFDRSFEWFVV